MRLLRTVGAIVTALAATFTFATPAFGLTYPATSPAGDKAYWNSDQDILTICDYTPRNGTANAILTVVGGGTWQLFDTNGAQSPCESSGKLSVADLKTAYLYACTNASSPCGMTEVRT
jgi:hypothetical protein